MISKEIAQQALDALEGLKDSNTDAGNITRAILAQEKLRAAIAQLSLSVGDSSGGSSRTASKARIRFASAGPNVIFDPCHVSDVTIDGPLGDVVMATVTLTPSGKGTWAST